MEGAKRSSLFYPVSGSSVHKKTMDQTPFFHLYITHTKKGYRTVAGTLFLYYLMRSRYQIGRIRSKEAW